MEEAAADADFLFLCVPVGKLGEYLEALSRLPLKPGAIITDVGSTKGDVMEAAGRLRFGGASFIGGHPMAGKERSGVEAATSRLFENAYYVLTPAADTDPASLDKLTALLKQTNANLVRLDARVHDEIVGAVSHLPHIVAALLVNLVAQLNDADDNYERLAAGGFRDITRIASSDASIWRDICISNRTVLLGLLRGWIGETERFISILEEGDKDRIEQEFTSAAAFRKTLPERRVGIMTTHFECYVEVVNEPGTIGRLTTELGKEGINLRNIGLIEERPGGPGSLKLSFADEDDLEKAMAILGRSGYVVQV